MTCSKVFPAKTRKELTEIPYLLLAASVLMAVAILITLVATNTEKTRDSVYLSVECPPNLSLHGKAYRDDLEGNTTVYNPDFTSSSKDLDKAVVGEHCNKTVLMQLDEGVLE